MNKAAPPPASLQRLRMAGFRPTRQRLALARILLEKGYRHIAAEHLHREATAAGIRVSLPTVYSALHQFTEAGLLREVVEELNRSYFDTNTTDHHHFSVKRPGARSYRQRAAAGARRNEVLRVEVIVQVDPAYQ